MQLDAELLQSFEGWFRMVETNGTQEIPQGLDWVTCSPKVAEHAIVPNHVNELKYIRHHGQGIPRPACSADHYLVSPAFEGNELVGQNLQWCVKLVMDNPQWRLTVQHHKLSFGGIE